jgi:Uma2 family endonuclease
MTILQERPVTASPPRDPLQNWPFPPPGGWLADDLDLIGPDTPDGYIDALKHVELIYGDLVLMSPQMTIHRRIIKRLCDALEPQAPEHLAVTSEMDVKLSRRSRPVPGVLVVDAEADENLRRTHFLPEQVALVVEVMSLESEDRDRIAKTHLYAEAGIPHFWRIEHEDLRPVVHVFELEVTTKTYAATGIVRDRLKLDVPFPIDIDVTTLTRRH